MAARKKDALAERVAHQLIIESEQVYRTARETMNAQAYWKLLAEARMLRNLAEDVLER